jgi:methylenetetrahydrofolate reductase (NADPH)
MTTIGSRRRDWRRARRALEELDGESRARLQRLISEARFVLLPTSEAIGLVESRLPPGTVRLGVACTAGLGVDQTVAVAEVLAAKGYDVTPHLAARQIRTPGHLAEILRRLRRRSIHRVLVVEGRQGGPGAFPDLGRLLAAMHDHRDVPVEIGIAGHPGGHPGHDPAELTERLLERSVLASFVSTRLSLDPDRLLGWLTEMRLRGLDLPVEAGVPGAVGLDELLAEDPSLVLPERRRATRYDPTRMMIDLARQPVIDRLDLAGLRVDTLNRIDGTAAWRQALYDLARPARSA